MKILDHQIKALDALAASLPQEEELRPYNSLYRGIISTRAVKYENVQKFAEDLKQHCELEIFTDTMQVTGTQSSAFGHEPLAMWLMRRAKQVGAKVAYHELTEYAENETFDAYEVAILAGVSVGQPTDIGNGVHIYPAAEVPILSLMQMIEDIKYSSLFLSERPGAFLIKRFAHKRLHIAGDERNPTPFVFGPAEDLRDAHLCMSVGGLVGPQIIAYGTQVGDKTPNPGGLGWALPMHRSVGISKNINQNLLDQIKQIHEAFSVLPEEVKHKLRIPMERINNYAALKDPVDKAIELGVALEALFLEDNNRSELRYQFSLRAATLLGTDAGSRHEIFDLMKTMYDLRSQAVHNGRIPKKLAEKAPDLMEKVAPLATKAVKYMIEEQGVDWKALILGTTEQ